MTDANPYQPPTEEHPATHKPPVIQGRWWHVVLLIALWLAAAVYAFAVSACVWELAHEEWHIGYRSSFVIDLIVAAGFGVVCLFAINMTRRADRRALLFAALAFGGLLMLFGYPPILPWIKRLVWQGFGRA